MHTILIVAITRDSKDLRTHLCALLRDVVLADVLSCNHGDQGSGDGKFLEVHGDGLMA